LKYIFPPSGMAPKKRTSKKLSEGDDGSKSSDVKSFADGNSDVSIGNSSPEKTKTKAKKPKERNNDMFVQETGFKGKPIAMTGRRYGVAITWDPVDFSKPVDLDLQAIIIDRRGYIVDAVYYNNLVALNGAVSHSGDEVTGQASDFDEMVWAVFAKLPDQVKMLLFVVAACGDSALRDAANATVHVVQEFHGHTVLRFPCEKSRADVDVIVMMEKDNDGKWWLYQVEEPAEHGEHFLDILEPTVGDIIRRRIDNAPKLQRVTFQMKKGAAVDLPKNALKRLNFSVMATIKAKVRKEIDLDISAVFADKEGNSLGACWHNNLEMWGFQHSGDRDSDEDINVDLMQVPLKVHQVYIIVDLVAPNYKEVSFKDITYASCMASDQNCKTLASFTLESEKDDCNNLPGLILCKLVRNSSKRWELEAVGTFVPGPSWKEACPMILQMNTSAKQQTEAQTLTAAAAEAATRRRSRLEYRGSLPAVAQGGAALFAEPGDAEQGSPGALAEPEVGSPITRTMSSRQDSEPPSMATMSMTMESGVPVPKDMAARRRQRPKTNGLMASWEEAPAHKSGEFPDSVHVIPPEVADESDSMRCRNGLFCRFLCPEVKG